MANEAELNELRERIGKLDGGAQARLLELVLQDNRQRRAEMQAELLAQTLALLDDDDPRRARLAPLQFPPEAKREAG